MGTVTIGELARLSGVGVETIRYYEREKLLDQPKRPVNGFRRYPPEALQRLSFVRRAKELGFTLDEIRDLLKLRARRGATCSTVCAKAQKKIAEIDERIAELQRLREALVVLADACTGEVAIEDCSILAAMEPKGESS